MSELIDFDVILARSDVAILRPVSRNYTTVLTIEIFGLEVQSGYAAVDATVSGTTYRIVNMYLEASDHSVRIDQIFVRNLELPVSVMTHTVGDEPSERLASGLGTSDHAGVVAHLAFK